MRVHNFSHLIDSGALRAALNRAPIQIVNHDGVLGGTPVQAYLQEERDAKEDYLP